MFTIYFESSIWWGKEIKILARISMQVKLKVDLIKQFEHVIWALGFATGTGMPMVFPRWVLWVQVQCITLPHRNTSCTHTAVLWAFMDIYNKVIFYFYYYSYPLFILCIHCDDQTEPTAHSHSRLKGFSHLSHFKKQSKSHSFLYFN